jgi:hypothetical protein
MDGDVSRGAQRAPSLQMPSESKLENQISKIENLKIEKMHLGKFQNLKAPKEFPKSGGCDLVDLKAASLLWCIRARNPNAISS